MSMNRVTIGICAYNEERNIEDCVLSILRQNISSAELSEIIVVSSGSTDSTDGIVRRLMSENPLLKLIVQDKREGKNSAINEVIRTAVGNIIVLVNADNCLAEDSLDHLLKPFSDPLIGMAGGRPMPTNDRSTAIGFAVHMLWDMHHRLAMIHPKIGELVAFRNDNMELPLNMQSDEDILRMELERKGYVSVYVPEAVVYNRGPENFSDFFKQRKRVNIGERMMRKSFRYEVPTWNSDYLFNAYLGFIRDTGPHPLRISMAIGVETCARAYATMHVAMDRGDISIWELVDSTKKLK